MEAGFRISSRYVEAALAKDLGGEIKASETGLILLPLYQALGDDGFFLGREVNSFWLNLSALLRRFKVGITFICFPEFAAILSTRNSLIINTRLRGFCRCRSFTYWVSVDCDGLTNTS
jgi:hypothetical protein